MSEGLSCWVFVLFFFFLGKKVDQVFSLSLPWTLSLSARRVCCVRPWKMAQATSSPEAVCFIISLSPSQVTLHLIRERLSLDAVEGQGGKPIDSWEMEVTLVLEQSFRGDNHLPTA